MDECRDDGHISQRLQRRKGTQQHSGPHLLPLEFLITTLPFLDRPLHVPEAIDISNRVTWKFDGTITRECVILSHRKLCSAKYVPLFDPYCTIDRRNHLNLIPRIPEAWRSGHRSSEISWWLFIWLYDIHLQTCLLEGVYSYKKGARKSTIC